jgi:DNA polymerase-4
MPMFKARALCPDAIVIKPDMAKYAAAGRAIRAMMQALTPLVEPLSIDEAFLDLAGADLLHGAPPAVTLARFAAAVEREVGVTVSIGLSYCKFLAKIASELDKPRGFSVIGRAEARDFLATRPAAAIFGVGAVAQRRLAARGIALIGDIQARGEAAMVRDFGEEGLRLWALANGLDARPVKPDRETKSVSAETTFERDLSDPEALARLLFGLCEKVSRRAKAQGLAGRSVTLKLKTAEFRTLTRQRSGLPATQLAARMFEPARDLLAAEADGRRFRLIGVGLGDLCPAGEADRGDLADPDAARVRAAEEAMESLRARFGDRAVMRGILFGGRS